VFVTSSLVVIMTPGPDLALITRLVFGGATFRSAFAASLGMVTAGALQIILGAIGLASLLRGRPDIFAAVRWTGAGVLLLWAGVAAWSALRPAAPRTAAQVSPHSRSCFAQGFLCTGSNPKVGIFLMAFLPQFVPAGTSPVTGVAILAAAYLSMCLVWLSAWTRLAHQFAARYLHSARATRVAQAVTAVVLTVFAVRMAVVS
jgi:threonine/homoserine/homoserine lactone efflux protein